MTRNRQYNGGHVTFTNKKPVYHFCLSDHHLQPALSMSLTMPLIIGRNYQLIVPVRAKLLQIMIMRKSDASSMAQR
ncbi:hypothetical protein E5358_13745 [Palleniella muris]|uniref:Uncharacterized protein n=1 Tax=Palleniella muris TaxID=3038145 RepID=A0AC61QLY2_9BACT|nr:hypothetical protein [Palleniella muris]TGX80113.1 hypothetical protein E5358_13745 [Palleniella muris]